MDWWSAQPAHWVVEGPTPLLREALGQALPLDPQHVCRPSVVAQLPHVLGHHIEEESDKALGADAGHWGQKGASAGLGQEWPGCSGHLSQGCPL